MRWWEKLTTWRHQIDYSYSPQLMNDSMLDPTECLDSLDIWESLDGPVLTKGCRLKFFTDYFLAKNKLLAFPRMRVTIRTWQMRQHWPNKTGTCEISLKSAKNLHFGPVFQVRLDLFSENGVGQWRGGGGGRCDSPCVDDSKRFLGSIVEIKTFFKAQITLKKQT